MTQLIRGYALAIEGRGRPLAQDVADMVFFSWESAVAEATRLRPYYERPLRIKPITVRLDPLTNGGSR